MTKRIYALVLVAACGSGDSKPSPKPAEEPAVVKKTESAPVTKPVVKPPDPSPAATEPEATAKDLEYVGKLDDQMKFPFKPAQDTFIDMELKPRIKDGMQVFDVLAANKVIDTIETGVEQASSNMEVKAKISAMKEGVMAAVFASKTTGKPADYTKGRVYEWDGAAMKLKRTFRSETVYDAADDER